MEIMFLTVENGPPDLANGAATPTLVIGEGERPDLTACDREAIHIVGRIQPHGFLLAVDIPTLTIVQVSANAPCGVAAGASLTSCLPDVASVLSQHLDGMQETGAATYLRTVVLPAGDGRQAYEVSAHRIGALAVVELEEVSTEGEAGLEVLYSRLRAFVERLHAATSIEELCALAAADIRHITGFDRALVYRFDKDWHGTVLAEDGNGILPSYLDLRFPASDIPAQARELYRRNRLRIIPDAGYVPVPVVPALTPKGQPLDLSQSVLRSVSPVHVEYMRNMGTMASMSVSILVDGALWGLISCHNRAPRRVPLQARNACDVLTQVFALQVASHQRASEAQQRVRLASIQSRLLGFMAEEERFIDGLMRHPAELMELADASGAAIVSNEQCLLVGVTPSESEVRELQAWLTSEQGSEDVYATDALGAAFRPAAAFADVASGLLAISISRAYATYVIWFRPEVVRTVGWGGNPTKPAVADPAGGPERLHPRKSFDIWKETVRGRSLPWSPVEVDATRDLRNAVIGIVLRRAEELASMSEELQRSNKELEAFSYSVSHDLRAPFRHIVGYSELLKGREGDRLSENGRRYVDVIIDAALSAGNLVDSLLNFSQMGRNSLNRVEGDMNVLVEEVRRKVVRDAAQGRAIRWDIGPLGRVYGDPVMLRLVVENLLSNAVKYTRNRPEAVIGISRDPRKDGMAGFVVRDNGVGFDMAYVDKLFGVFQRLHRVEEFEGTGIGLANVRRIVERHGGETWAEGEVDKGAAFHFTLPTRKEAT